MDFTISFSPELEQFRKTVGDWLDANKPSLLHTSDPRERTAEDEANRIALRRAMGHQGWLYPTGNPVYGGGGLSLDHAVIINQELERRDIYGLTSSGAFAVSCIMIWGSAEQKQEFAAPIMRGDQDAWQLLTEPQGGSDLASTRTTAIRDGDDYVINGQKIFVGDERPVDWLWTIVRSDPEGPRHRNLSYLMVPADTPGITIQPLHLLSSATGYEHPHLHKTIVFFDDARVSSRYLVGGHNEGWKVASSHLELEHGGGGNISADKMLERLVAVLEELEWNGKPLIEDPEVRDILGETLQEREILRLFGMRNYWMRHSGVRMEHDGPQLSYWRKTRAHQFVQRVHDLLGPYALTRDPKYMVARGFLELLNRAVFVTVHAGGGLNIQGTIVARRLGLGRNVREEAGQLPT